MFLTGCAVNPLYQVNKDVNKFSYVLDEDQFGKVDYWQLPKEMLVNKQGDCEDYAITKAYLLLKQGYTEDRLTFVVLQLHSFNTQHLVLLVDNRWVLDNYEKSIYGLISYKLLVNATELDRFSYKDYYEIAKFKRN